MEENANVNMNENVGVNNPIFGSNLKFSNFDFLKRISGILKGDPFEMSFDFTAKTFILTFGEADVPILIHEEKCYDENLQNPRTVIVAELYTELTRHNLTAYEINQLNQLVSFIEANQEAIQELFS